MVSVTYLPAQLSNSLILIARIKNKSPRYNTWGFLMFNKIYLLMPEYINGARVGVGVFCF